MRVCLRLLLLILMLHRIPGWALSVRAPSLRSCPLCASARGKRLWASQSDPGRRGAPEPANIFSEVEGALRGPCQIKPGTGILILVSGGSDSMALLHLLHGVRARWSPPLHLEVAHFNHGLREESEEEERFVTATCGALGVRAHVVRSAEGAGSGMQERAREWRRAESRRLLDGMPQQKGGGAGDGAVSTGPAPAEALIATAHHADDEVETFMLKLLRGAHLSHLRGMEARSGVFIKPLLGLTKDRLVGFLESRRLEWREDASNMVDKYNRNKVRLRVLPQMAEVAGGPSALRQRVEELSMQSRALEAWLDAEVEAWEGREVERPEELPLAPLQPLPRLLREALVRRFVKRGAGVGLPYAQVHRVLEHIDGPGLQWALYVADDWVAERQGAVLRLRRADAEGIKPRESGEKVVRMGGVELVLPGGWSAEARRFGRGETQVGVGTGEGEKRDCVVLHNVPEGARLHVRRRRDGDRFHPTWKQRPLKVKDFLRGQKVPLHRRDDVPLVCLGEEVLALYPSQVCKSASVDRGAERPLVLRLRTGEES